MIVKILDVPVEYLSKLFEVLDIESVDDLRDLDSKDFSKLWCDDVLFIYAVSNITPHELLKESEPEYKIGLTGRDVVEFLEYKIQLYPKDSEYKQLLNLFKENKLRVKHVVKLLDLSNGDLGLVNICASECEKFVKVKDIIKNYIKESKSENSRN